MSDPYGQPADPYGQSPWSPPGPERQPGYQQPGYQQQPGPPQQPSYEAPTYGQPTYQQPTYQPTSGGGYQSGDYQGGPAAEPGWPAPYPGQPGATQPPPRRRPTGLIIAAVAIVAVVLIVTVVAVVNLVGKSDRTTPTAANASSGSSATATATATATADPTATTAAPTHASPTITLTTPDRIGTLRKKADQSRASSIRSAMQSAGLGQPFAVIYEDTAAKGHEVTVWGGSGGALGVGNPQTELDAFFSSAGKQLGSGVTLGSRSDVDTGSAGGKVQCSKVNGTGTTMTLCAWLGDNVIVGFIFSGTGVDKAGGQIRTIVPAVVVKS
jgi:hypothetical protein